MTKLVAVLALLLGSSGGGGAQLWLSPVSSGDCVAPRLYAERSKFVKEWEKQDCRLKSSDEQIAAKCVEGARLNEAAELVFFTDRCHQEEFFIGINGREYRLRKVSPNRKPHYFIGTFIGEDLRVEIKEPRLLTKTYLPGEPQTEDYVLDADYAVRVVVTRGRLQKAFKATLWYGR